MTHSTRPTRQPSRRQFLNHAGTALLATSAMGISPSLLAAPAPAERAVKLQNLHTGESAHVTFWVEGTYLTSGLDELAYLMRDHRQNLAASIDVQLVNFLHNVQQEVGNGKAIQVISGYRSEKTNEWLYRNTEGVAPRSLHLEGKAIDYRIEGIATNDLYRLSRGYRVGGVGRYLRSGFVHVDTGRVRTWG